MNDSKKQFVERLLDADRPSPDLRRRYEKEVHAMLEKSIGPRQRRLCLVAAVLLGLLGGGWSLMGLGTLATAVDRKDLPVEVLPAYLIVAFGVFTTGLALLLVAGMLLRASWKGVFNQRNYREWATGAGVTYAGLLGLLSLLLCRYLSEMLRDPIQVFGLVLLLYAAVAWVRHCIAQAEMRTAEKLLEIELRLAEIGEDIKAGPPTDASSPQQEPSA
jgi:hypothetical protein